MKKPFFMIDDYGAGSVVVKVYARSLSEVEAVLPKPTWHVLDSNDPRMASLGSNLPESDIDDKADWLKELTYINQRKAEGKSPFPVRGRRWHIFPEERNLWARSMDEVATRFPSLEFRYYVPWSCKKHSDIDVRDKFIARYEKKVPRKRQ